jgi:hypothetical protein
MLRKTLKIANVNIPFNNQVARDEVGVAMWHNAPPLLHPTNDRRVANVGRHAGYLTEVQLPGVGPGLSELEAALQLGKLDLFQKLW